MEIEIKRTAERLVNKMLNTELIEPLNQINLGSAKQCAAICCDEIINLCASGLSETKFWIEVKKEILK